MSLSFFPSNNLCTCRPNWKRGRNPRDMKLLERIQWSASISAPRKTNSVVWALCPCQRRKLQLERNSKNTETQRKPLLEREFSHEIAGSLVTIHHGPSWGFVAFFSHFPHGLSHLSSVFRICSAWILQCCIRHNLHGHRCTYLPIARALPHLPAEQMVRVLL